MALLRFAVLILLGIWVQSGTAFASALESGSRGLPVIEKRDIRFDLLSVGGRPFQKRILAIAQDNYGFVWLGTDDGLYRYDGYTVKQYGHNGVLVIYKDRAGILWIGTHYGGLERFDPARDAFRHYRHDPDNDQSLRDNHVYSIREDSTGALWVGTNSGLDRLDVATGHFFHYEQPSEDGARRYRIWGLYEDQQGNLLAGCARGLYKADRASGRLSLFLDNSILSGGSGDRDVEWFAQDRSGALWFTSPARNSLGSFNIKTGELRRYAFKWQDSKHARLVRVSRVHEDGNGVLWIGTVRDGLLKFGPERKKFIHYPTDRGAGISGQIWALFEDPQGRLWAGSEAGASRFQTRPSPFVNYQHDPRNPNSLRNDKVLSVHSDAWGFLWIGTEGGLYRLERKTGRMVLYQHDGKDPTSLSHNAVSAIREDGSGGLWVGTHGGGLNQFDRASGRFFAYRHDPNDSQSLSNDLVLSVLAEPTGIVWVGTEEGGLNRFDPVTDRFKSYRNDPRIHHSLSFDLVRVLFLDRAGTLWAGTNHGLNRFNRDTESFAVYRHDERNPSGLSNEGITSMFEDRQGTLWIGTRGGGLNRFNRTSGTFEHFDRQDGLASDIIEAIRGDARGNLWLATHDGISKFDPRTKTVRNYSEADGLPGDFAESTGTERTAETPEGELVFGSDRGLTVFNPAHISSSLSPSPVVLTDLLLFNRPVALSAGSPLQQPIWATRALTLNHEQSIFTLEFATLSYIAPERNRYRYKLEGLEKDWNVVGADRRTATYTNLAPGTYTFRVQGSDADLVWNENGVHLEITVLPPWWATWLFRSAVFLCAACLAVVVYRWRLLSLRLAARKLELEVAARTSELRIARDAADSANHAKSAFLATMSHELRTPLNAILGFSSLLSGGDVSEQQRKQLNIINRSGEHLLNLINEVLDLARVEAGRIEMHIESCDLKRLVMEITEMMSQRATEKDIELRLNQSPDFPRLVKTDAGKLRQVLINLLGNAIKFTEKGCVELRLSSRAPGNGQPILVAFEVGDTGVGISPEDQQRIFDAFVQAGRKGSRKGTGLGLTISRRFVALLGGTIEVESTPGKGSRFRVELPAEPAEESDATRSAEGEERVVGVETNGEDYRVLIVEDGEANRLLLQQLMLDSGFSVQLAENGARGVETFQTWRPHFIWMDLRMPVLDGTVAIRRIRCLESGQDVKIVAVTASALAFEREEALAAGADDLVRKPYQTSEIFDCLARHLGLRPRFAKPHEQEGPGALRKGDFEVLPASLVSDLRLAVVTLDNKRIREVVGRISEYDANIGRRLNHLAGQFAYTAILEAARIRLGESEHGAP